MTQAEYIIVILLGIIAYFLYQIARQLTFLSGRKMRSPFVDMFRRPTQSKLKSVPKEEKFTN